MALERDLQTEEAVRKNEFIVLEIYDIELNDGRILYLTSNNENVTWGNNTYIAFPIEREKTSQEGSLRVGDNTIKLGDKDSLLTKETFNNLSVILNSFVTIRQQRESIDKNIMLGFRQIARGRVKSVSASPGIIMFTIVGSFSDPQKPLNDVKWGEFPGMIDAARKTI